MSILFTYLSIYEDLVGKFLMPAYLGFPYISYNFLAFLCIFIIDTPFIIAKLTYPI